DVYQDNDEQVFAIPFVKLDNTLDHLSQDLRALVERSAQRMRSLKDTYHNASITRRESQSLVARSRGKPYLAVDRGRKVIRDYAVKSGQVSVDSRVQKLKAAERRRPGEATNGPAVQSLTWTPSSPTEKFFLKENFLGKRDANIRQQGRNRRQVPLPDKG